MNIQKDHMINFRSSNAAKRAETDGRGRKRCQSRTVFDFERAVAMVARYVNAPYEIHVIDLGAVALRGRRSDGSATIATALA